MLKYQVKIFEYNQFDLIFLINTNIRLLSLLVLHVRYFYLWLNRTYAIM